MGCRGPTLRLAVAVCLALLLVATAAHAVAPDVSTAHILAGAHTADPAAAFAVPTRPGALPSAAGGLLRVALALLVVVAAIFGAGWLSRRVHGTSGARHPGLEVLAQLPLGPRERAVLIRVGAQQLLVGVAGGCIRTLHVCESGSVAAGNTAPEGAGADALAAAVGTPMAARPSFKALLLKSLGK
jgi:flagellar protein FliO/FliZ